MWEVIVPKDARRAPVARNLKKLCYRTAVLPAGAELLVRVRDERKKPHAHIYEVFRRMNSYYIRVKTNPKRSATYEVEREELICVLWPAIRIKLC